jgi:dockerin type I repeat protein
VNAADLGLTKSHVGELILGSNFRADVNANGDINASDVGVVKSRLGTGLP